MSNKYSSLLKAYNSDGEIDEEKVNEIVVFYMDNAKAGKKAGGADPFWDKTQKAFFTALIYYVLENDDIPVNKKNFSTILHKVQMAMGIVYDEDNLLSREMNAWFKKMEAEGKHCRAAMYYDAFFIAPPRTKQAVIVNTAIDLQVFPREKDDTMFYYGTNKTDHTPIMYDRTDMTSSPQHRAIFGNHGSGRHFLVKSEIVQIVKSTNDIVYVLDFNMELTQMAELLGGCVVPVTRNSLGCVNPIIIPDTSNFVVLEVDETLYAKGGKETAIYMCLAAMWQKIEAANKAGNTNQRFWIFVDEMLPIIHSAYAEIFYTMIEKGRTYNCNITYGSASFATFCESVCDKAVLANTPILTLLNLSPEDRGYLSELYNLSSEELCNVINQPCGNGLFCVNGNNIPFVYLQNNATQKMFTAMI